MKRVQVVVKRRRRASEPKHQPANQNRARLHAASEHGHRIREGCCLCGVLVARHFDRANRFVSCQRLRVPEQLAGQGA